MSAFLKNFFSQFQNLKIYLNTQQSLSAIVTIIENNVELFKM